MPILKLPGLKTRLARSWPKSMTLITALMLQKNTSHRHFSWGGMHLVHTTPSGFWKQEQEHAQPYPSDE